MAIFERDAKVVLGPDLEQVLQLGDGFLRVEFENAAKRAVVILRKPIVVDGGLPQTVRRVGRQSTFHRTGVVMIVSHGI